LVSGEPPRHTLDRYDDPSGVFFSQRIGAAAFVLLGVVWVVLALKH